MNNLVTIILFVLLIILLFTCYNYKKNRKINKHKIYVEQNDYNIEEIPNFLTEEECNKVIDLTNEKLTPSNVYTKDKDLYITENRKSEQCWLDDNITFIKNISDKIKKYSNTYDKYHEQFQVVNYKSGGFFIPHYDACDGDENYCERMNQNNGPRYLTFLIYLNDNFEGGETIFPNINKKIKPEKGKAVIFKNIDENENIIKQSLHGGEPVRSGQKWIINKWIHLY